MRVLRQIHAHILTRSLPISSVSFSLSKILAFCALCSTGDIDYARKVFDRIPHRNIFSWNCLIRGYSQIRNPSREPFFLFRDMVKRGYPSPNSFTFAFVLKSCSVVLAFEEGRQVHARLLRSGFALSPFVQTALVNFYVQYEEMGLARKVFDEMSERDVVMWSVMINGCARFRMVNEVFGLFREMQMAGVVPDQVTMVSVISACTAAGTLDIGRWVHAFIRKEMVEMDLELCTALLNMYVKCGCIERAKEIFDGMAIKDTKAWGSMIVGLAIHGFAEEALEAFSRMEEAKVKPDHVTFVGVLTACAHNGLIIEGWRYWSRMIEYGIEPLMQHYACMVDLLCRVGQVEGAYTVVKKMHISPDSVIWKTLLVGCKKNKMIDRGEVVAAQLLRLEPRNAENYVLFSHLYASVSQWEKMSHIRLMMKKKGIKRLPGCSFIEINGCVHEFVSGDWSHPEAEEIRGIVKDIMKRVHGSGYKPSLLDVLHNLVGGEKETDLSEHSERLAIAYGLLKTKSPTVIMVVKNLRFCEDCHEVTKIISKVYQRDILIRDQTQFHKFVNGTCSCRDYW